MQYGQTACHPHMTCACNSLDVASAYAMVAVRKGYSINDVHTEGRGLGEMQTQ